MSRDAKRCSSCHGRFALSHAWRSPNRGANRPVGGPVGSLIHAFTKSGGVIARAFIDRRGALVVGPSGLYVVECVAAGRIADREVDWANRVDRALGRGGATFIVVRSEADVRELVERVGATAARRDRPATTPKGPHRRRGGARHWRITPDPP